MVAEITFRVLGFSWMLPMENDFKSNKNRVQKILPSDRSGRIVILEHTKIFSVDESHLL